MRLMDALERYRAPMAWTVFFTGIGGFLATFPFGVTTSIAETDFWVTLAGFFLLTLDGYDKLMDLRDSDQLDDIEDAAG